VEDFDHDSVDYCHRGLDGEQHERLGAGMILDSSILTARGIPMAGEYELRTSIAMLAGHAIGAGGSFTDIQALNPAHLAVSAKDPLLRGLGVCHGKRGWGVSVEFDVRPGPVTTYGVGPDRDGSSVFITSEGEVTPGPLLEIRNTTSRVDFGCNPGVWVDEWSQTGVGHDWALCLGHRATDIKAAANLPGIEHRHVSLGGR
jgi:L-arabinose isomerase